MAQLSPTKVIRAKGVGSPRSEPQCRFLADSHTSSPLQSGRVHKPHLAMNVHVSLPSTDIPHSSTDILKHFVMLFASKAVSFMASLAVARISKAKRRKRVTRDMSTLKNSMLELAAKFDDNYNTGLIKSFMFGLNKTEIKTMTDILSRYKFRDSHATQRLLATEHVILNHGQVTWTTPELSPPLLTTTPHQQPLLWRRTFEILKLSQVTGKILSYGFLFSKLPYHFNWRTYSHDRLNMHQFSYIMGLKWHMFRTRDPKEAVISSQPSPLGYHGHIYKIRDIFIISSRSKLNKEGKKIV
ncbi:hypothetical protein TNCV_651411 [Trichonephila clavipes]|nr:hypothetical protein TNCV_651411 [Trichonephila clavipes]